jgi:hypothetical protein
MAAALHLLGVSLSVWAVFCGYYDVLWLRNGLIKWFCFGGWYKVGCEVSGWKCVEFEVLGCFVCRRRQRCALVLKNNAANNALNANPPHGHALLPHAAGVRECSG